MPTNTNRTGLQSRQSQTNNSGNGVNDFTMVDERMNGSKEESAPTCSTPLPANGTQSTLHPPPPPIADDTARGRPPLSPPRDGHSRKHSAESLISEVTMAESTNGLSWDAKSVKDEIDEASKEEKQARQELKKRPSKPSRVLTLSEVSKTCPIEEEAEKLILKSLDEKKERPTMGSTILPHVPTDSTDAFETTPKATNSAISEQNYVSSSSADANEPTMHTGVPTQDRKEANEQQPPSSVTSSGSSEKDGSPGGNNDAFLRNANILFRSFKQKTGKRLNHSDSSVGDIEQGTSDDDSDPNGKEKGKRPHVGLKQFVKKTRRDAQNEITIFDGFLQPFKSTIRATIKNLFIFVVLPLAIVASILFYGTGNPKLGKTGASVSYFLLFLVRNVVSLLLAKATSVYVIQYLSLKRRFTVKVRCQIVWQHLLSDCLLAHCISLISNQSCSGP